MNAFLSDFGDSIFLFYNLTVDVSVISNELYYYFIFVIEENDKVKRFSNPSGSDSSILYIKFVVCHQFEKD